MFGGQGLESFRGVVANQENDVFVVGSQNTNYVIANIGQQIGAASWFNDAFLVKFNEVCEAVYISYYGGAQGADQFVELDLLSSTNELHIVGYTSSPDLSDINSVEMEDESFGGLRDGLYVKFDSNGQLLFHTYVGGDGFDDLVDIKVDYIEAPYDETIIYYIGNTESGTGWPEFTNNAVNQSMEYSGGKDGFYIKRSGSSEIQEHRTFFGSSSNDVFIALGLFKGTPVILGRTTANEYSTVQGVLPTDGLFPKNHIGFVGYDFMDNNNTVDCNYFITHFGNINPGATQFVDKFKWSSFIAPSPTIVNIAGHMPENLGDLVVSAHDNIPPSNANVYVTGLTPIPSNPLDIELPLEILGWHQSVAGGGDNDAFILQWRLENLSSTLLRGTLYGGDGSDIGRGLALDADNNLFLSGTSTINNIASNAEWCETPTTGNFPMCDQNGLLYSETDIFNSAPRAFVTAFKPTGDMLWSTQYGMGDQNSALDICTNENYVWIVGNSSKDWTFEEFDDAPGSTDYYRALINEQTPNINEASIARFDIQYMIQTSDIDLQINNTLDVYPNPSEGRFTVIMPQYDDIHNAEIAIFNSLGQIMERVPNSNDQKFVIDLTKYARGIYCLRLTGLKTSYSASLIKL
jgi:hypothetical protein